MCQRINIKQFEKKMNYSKFYPDKAILNFDKHLEVGFPWYNCNQNEEKEKKLLMHNRIIER